MPDLKALYCHINLALGQPPSLSENIVLIGPAVAGFIRSGRLKMTSHQQESAGVRSVSQPIALLHIPAGGRSFLYCCQSGRVMLWPMLAAC